MKFNAKEWVQLAKDAGMKYLTITSKHHDGFALFKSNASPYNVVDATPYGKDLIAQLAKACKNANIKLCLYYSQKQDWHHPNASGNTLDINPDKQNFSQYMNEKGLPQVKEILTQYGPIGMIWYDTPQDITPAQTKKFIDAVYKHQPNCLVNGRAGHGLGDYQSMGDNLIPPARVDGDWETPATLNDTWGFKKNDHNWKPADGLIRRLVDIVSKGGNYLLNVGPTAEGIIPKPSVVRLKKVGDWLKINGDAIYGASASPHPYEFSWGAITSKGRKLYLNIWDWPQGTFTLYGLKNKVRNAYLLSDKNRTPLKKEQTHDSTIDLDVLTLKIPGKNQTKSSRLSCWKLPVNRRWMGPCFKMPTAAFNSRPTPASGDEPADRAAPFKDLGAPVIAVNELDEIYRALEVFSENRADLIAIGHGLIADPEWPIKVRENRFDDIVTCMKCDEGCFGNLKLGEPVACVEWTV